MSVSSQQKIITVKYHLTISTMHKPYGIYIYTQIIREYSNTTLSDRMHAGNLLTKFKQYIV